MSRNDGRIVDKSIDGEAMQELVRAGLSMELVGSMKDGSIQVRPHQRWFQFENECVWVMAMVDLEELQKRNVS